MLSDHGHHYQRGICLSLLLSLGLEGDVRVETALDHLYSMHIRFGGFCETNIKKPFVG